MPDRLLSTFQVADLLGATPGAVVEWIQKGLLPVQKSPDGAMRISQEALIQFLKARGQGAEPILARLGPGLPSRGESQEADADLPRLDLAEYALAAPRSRASHSEGIERMFPLDPVASPLPQAKPKRAARSTQRDSQPAADEDEEWLAMDDEEDQQEAAPQESSEQLPAEAPAETVPPVTPGQSEVPLDETEPAPQADYVPPVLAPQEVEVAPEIAAPAPQAGGAAEAAMALVRQAVARRASEVHIASTAAGLSLGLRIDGLMHEAHRCGLSIPGRTVAAAMQQLLDLVGTRHADPRRPSVGQVDLLVDDREVAMTVATCPTTFGQRMVVSLADPQAAPPSLAILGLEPLEEKRLAQVLAGASGLVLLLARPGPQRAAALEAMVWAMGGSSRSLVMVTHQPSAPAAGLTPVVASPSADFSVAQAVRAAAEQDADGIVVPDVRDGDTVPALLAAAEAGRGVLAATSAPSAASAVAMLLEAHLDPWPLATHLKAVVATTTVRRLCPHCRRPAAPDDQTLAALGLMREEVGQAFTPGGCDECFNIGYCGVMGCSSAMLMDERLGAAFRSGSSPAELTEAVEQAGARPLLQVGLDMVREGLTSLEELARCLPR